MTVSKRTLLVGSISAHNMHIELTCQCLPDVPISHKVGSDSEVLAIPITAAGQGNL